MYVGACIARAPWQDAHGHGPSVRPLAMKMGVCQTVIPSAPASVAGGVHLSAEGWSAKVMACVLDRAIAHVGTAQYVGHITKAVIPRLPL